jgi:hypothetical protein
MLVQAEHEKQAQMTTEQSYPTDYGTATET